MAIKLIHDVSGTAFVTNYSRSKLVNLSHDWYAHLWVTPESISLWDELSHNVYPHDAINLGLRNRFFLDHINQFASTNADSVIISIAAGFENYPFLAETYSHFIEIDLPNIINFKKNKVRQWIIDKRLPKRDIEFISIDLNDHGQRMSMKETLKKIIKNKHSFILMEGLTYYLKSEILSEIFGMLREIQNIGSLVTFDYWKPDALQYPVMQKLKEYFNNKFGSSGENWNLFDDSYIKKIKGYIEIESIDIAGLERDYSDTSVLQGDDNKIPGHFSVLQMMD
jgi:O-methyltransferase involved in polyketide biosynthesis